LLKAWTNPGSGFTLLAAYFVLAVALFALEFVPGVQILLVLLAPLWSGLLVHIAMAQFVFFAALGRISRAWLALPIGFYAGGFALHLYSVHAAEAAAAAVNARNAAVQLAAVQARSS
jgi:hypothetical protein